MAGIGKAFGWITRTLLGTESPANLDRHRCRSHSHNSNELASKSDDNLGLDHVAVPKSKAMSSESSDAESSVDESRFSLNSRDTTNDSVEKTHSNTTNHDTTVDESFIRPTKRKLKRVIIESDSESESQVNDSVIPETDDDQEEEEDDDDNKSTDADKNGSSAYEKIDSDEDVDQHELSNMHCYSPRTRRSITGRRSILPVANSSDENVGSDDDIFASDDDDEFGTNINNNNSDNSSNDKTTKAPTESSAYKSADSTIDDDDDDHTDADLSSTKHENSKRNRSIDLDKSSIANQSMRTPKPKRFSGIGMNVDDESGSTDDGSKVEDVSDADADQFRTSTPSIEFSDKSAASRASKSDHSIEIQSDHSMDLMKSIVHDISVVTLNSSDEENHKPVLNSTAIPSRNIGPLGGAIPKFQPKLNFNKQTKTAKKFVSREYYQDKANELADLEKELTDVRNLLQRLGATLPDKGRNLEQRSNDLKRNIEKKRTELDTYAIEEDHLNDVQFIGTVKPKAEPNANDWRKELDTIQPIHTGKQGMATFNTQKTLTLNRIEKLHKAMEKCPAETDLAPQPNYLGIQLMPHQLHAIKWMSWREKTKRPKGGLLADDMGLGKTLTAIGLVLHQLYGEDDDEDEVADEQESENDDDDDDDDVDRGYKKSYKYQGGTLIVCPASLINQWEHEIKNHVKRRKLTVIMHHGNKRTESAHALCKGDVVITTYGIVNSEHKNQGVLFRVRWDRIVLDEAHTIRTHSTDTSKSCCDLRSEKRWGLTGTPIQNKHMDVYSMLKFLRVTPFDDLPTFKKWINPNSEAGMSRLHNILKPLLLRRTKAELQTKGELQGLPNKNIHIEDIELSPDEASVYTKILAYSQTLFAQYMEQHQQRNGGGKFVLDADVRRRLEQVKRFGRGGEEVKSAQILILLLRLRQICDHPGLIHQMLQDECEMEELAEEDADTMDMNIVKQMIGLKINVGDSEQDRNSSSDDSDTPAARANILCASNKVYDFKQKSSKCKRACEIVQRVLRETDDKIVVVSQWTTFLTIVADFLHREKVHYVELTGKTPIKDRNDIVVNFNKPHTPERVMMLSLVAGGVGLNLVGANHLILLDPHWNPQLESQAFDRVYRVGQTKNVHIYKLLCEKTVEKKIQSIQEAKLQLSENVLTGSKQNSGTKLSMQDMCKLFDM